MDNNVIDDFDDFDDFSIGEEPLPPVEQPAEREKEPETEDKKTKKKKKEKNEKSETADEKKQKAPEEKQSEGEKPEQSEEKELENLDKTRKIPPLKKEKKEALTENLQKTQKITISDLKAETKKEPEEKTELKDNKKAAEENNKKTVSQTKEKPAKEQPMNEKPEKEQLAKEKPAKEEPAFDSDEAEAVYLREELKKSREERQKQRRLEMEEEENESAAMPEWLKTVLFFVAWILVMNFLAIIYISKSRNVYFWDDATYWDIARKLASGALEPDFWTGVYNSIITEDYNYVAGLLSSVFVRWFGESRLVYVLGILNCYMVPSMICIYALAKRLGRSPKATMSMVMLICPVITFLTFCGFVDVGGLLMCLVCYLLYYRKDGKSAGIAKHILIGVVLVMLVLWRRWYAFFAVSFITGMLADGLLFRRKWYYTLITAFVAAAIIVFGFRDFLIEKLLQNYGTMYASYKYALDVDVKLVTRYFGVIFLAALAGGSIIVALVKRENRVLLPWIQMVVCFSMFAATQTHGQQHLLLYIPSMIVLMIFITKYVTDKKIVAAIVLLMAANSINICIPREQPNNIQEIKHYALIPDFSMLPQVRNDVYPILSLKNKLDTVVGEGETLGVLASSFKINGDILRNIEPSLGVNKNRVDYLVELPQVDSRDKDMSNYYNVNYILVATPAQTHLAEGSQTVVTRAVESFALMSDFASSYEELPEYETVIDDVTLKLYKRTGTVSDIQKLEFETRLYVQD